MTIAVDTNVLVRLAVGDDKKQLAAVRRLFQEKRVLILKTVLLETEWVLRSRYDYQASDTSAFFSFLAGLSNVSIEDRNAVETAIAGLDTGLDFADALHAASAAEAPLLTFDKFFVQRAGNQFDVRLMDID